MSDSDELKDLAPTERFSRRADVYQRGRPGYPPALLPFFASELGLQPADAVADVASGTGLLTQLFVENGNPTFAVEPNESMRAAAEALLGWRANFHSVVGTAEATTLASQSVRLVTVAQAFHWCDPPKAGAEFRRVLSPDGWVAIIWNDRREDSAFVQAYDRLNETYLDGTIRRARQFRKDEDERLRELFGSDAFSQRRFDNPQRLDRAGLRDRIVSSSYMPLPDQSGYDAVVRGSDELFQQFQSDGLVTIPQETLVIYGQLG